MITIHKLSEFIGRIFRGEDMVLVPQTKEQWERQFVDGRWDRLQKGQANTTEIAQRISDYADTKGGRIRVLDVGCGNGGLAHLIAQKVEYTGIDIAVSAIASARALAPQGTFLVADAANPPEDLGVFDILVFNEVLYYLDPRAMLTRYRMYASAGAQVYISIVRFWRSPLLWRRIKQNLRLDKRFVAKDSVHRWDIAIGHFV